MLAAVNAGRTTAQAPPAYIEAMDANLTRNWAPLTGIVSGAFKLIDLPVPELYDLARDPGEATNLFTRDAERARVLGALLRQRVRRVRQPRGAGFAQLARQRGASTAAGARLRDLDGRSRRRARTPRPTTRRN